MKLFQAVYECNIQAPTLRAAKKQLAEVFEFGVTPREVCEEMVEGLALYKEPKPSDEVKTLRDQLKREKQRNDDLHAETRFIGERMCAETERNELLERKLSHALTCVDCAEAANGCGTFWTIS